MRWKKINPFLEKFNSNTTGFFVTKKVISNVLMAETGILVNPRSITVKNKTVFLDIDPGEKFTVFKKRIAVQKKLKNDLGVEYSLR